MTSNGAPPNELLDLLEALCEDRITAADMARLEQLVRADRAALRLYLDYIDLHGTLYWDTARGAESRPLASRVDISTRGGSRPLSRSVVSSSRRRWTVAAVALAACSIVIAVVALNWPPAPQPNVAGGPDDGSPSVAAGQLERDSRGRRRSFEPIKLSSTRPSPDDSQGHPSDSTDNSAPEPRATVADALPTAGVLAFIDEQIRRGWQAAGVEPSPRADDAEWIRRVYLDIVGHIPPAGVVEKFLADPSPRKRSALVEKLLDDPAYVRNCTTIWTNLLVGRSMQRDIDRPALQKFLREQFARNRPWSETVYELVAAEGEAAENGAANFLIAHVNNQAVPATAVTARLFLGVQVQCMQCHDHPFNENWKQEQFWALNSFFKQTDLVRREERDPRTGRTMRDLALVSREEGGPTYYETRGGLMRVAYPEFSGTKVSPEADVNRRRELARLMIEGERPLVAPALVNRMWQHFFGYGFTRPVDDMGPHNPPTHPELLERLAAEFVRSGYDVKQLIRWICQSEAYQLTSRYGEANRIDDPVAGETPLFSRVYVKPMTAEQLYDSLLVATRADYAGKSNWDAVARQRQNWLQQFVYAFQTDENDEATSFEGTIPQALMLMNGELVNQALAAESGTFFHEVLYERSDETDKIRKLCLSALSRYPTPKELSLIRKALRERAAGSANRQRAVAEGLQDAFWAFLNSSEFVLIH